MVPYLTKPFFAILLLPLPKTLLVGSAIYVLSLSSGVRLLLAKPFTAIFLVCLNKSFYFNTVSSVAIVIIGQLLVVGTVWPKRCYAIMLLITKISFAFRHARNFDTQAMSITVCKRWILSTIYKNSRVRSHSENNK